MSLFIVASTLTAIGGLKSPRFLDGRSLILPHDFDGACCNGKPMGMELCALQNSIPWLLVAGIQVLEPVQG